MNNEFDLNQLHRDFFGQLVATLTSRIRDLTLAEDIAQEAFTSALIHWKDGGVPANPRAWLSRTAMNSAIDHMRRTKLHQESLPDVTYLYELQSNGDTDMSVDTDLHPALRDDMLRLIFCCCHPALNLNARVALALKIVCGLETADIARAFIVPEATMAQRLVRAKQKIQKAGIAWHIPDAAEIDARIDAVLSVIYLVFNEGYSKQQHSIAISKSLTEEAIGMGRNLASLLPHKSKIQALLALMLLQHSRRDARFDAAGDIILLRNQDRSLWNRAAISEGKALIHHVFGIGEGNSGYAIQAAIAAIHADAESVDTTDWNEIVKLYEHLIKLDSSPVVALNHAVALAECDGPDAGLKMLECLIADGQLNQYHLFHATHANFLRRAGRSEEANLAYRHAIALAHNESDRRFLKKQLN